MNICWDIFWDLAVMWWVLFNTSFVTSSVLAVNTSWDIFCVLVGMGWVWSTHVEMPSQSCLEWDLFGQHMLRCILCPSWNGWYLVYSCWDTVIVLAGIGGDWSTHVEMHYVFSLYWDNFDLYKSRYILCLCCHFDRVGQHKLSFILCPRWHCMGSVQH